MSNLATITENPLDLLHDSFSGIVEAHPALKSPLPGRSTMTETDLIDYPASVMVEHLSWMKSDFAQAYDVADWAGGEHRDLAKRVIALAGFSATLGVADQHKIYGLAVARAGLIATTGRIGRIRNALALRAILEVLATAEMQLRTLPVMPGSPTIFSILSLDPAGPPLPVQLGIDLDTLPKMRGPRGALTAAETFPILKRRAIEKLTELARIANALSVTKGLRAVCEQIAMAAGPGEAGEVTQWLSSQIEGEATTFETISGQEGAARRICTAADGVSAIERAFGYLDDCERFGLPNARAALAIIEEWHPLAPLPVVEQPLKAEAKAPEAVKGTEPEDGNMPAEAYELPGVMQTAFEHLISNATRRQRVLALGSTIALMATVVSRKIVGDGSTLPNIYVMNIAETGAGKEAPLRYPGKVFSAAGLMDRLAGPESVTSDSAIEQHLAQPGCESALMFVDEAGKVFGHIKNKNASTHLAAVEDLLLRLFNAGAQPFRMKSRAGSVGAFIDRPHLSVLATSTPGIWSAFETGSIQDGFLNRFLFFDAGNRMPRRSTPPNSSVPDAVTQWVTAWANEHARPNPMNIVGGAVASEPRIISLSPEARIYRDHIGEETDDWLRQASKDAYAALVARTFEHSMRLALIRSSAWGPVPQQEISAQDIRWGYAIARASARSMIEVARLHIADSPFEQQTKRVYAKILQAGARGITKALLTDRLKALTERQLGESLGHLRTAGRVILTDTNTGLFATDGRRMRAREAFIATELNPDWTPED